MQGGTVESEDDFFYGPAAEWGGVRNGYESNRGPLTVVAGVGDKAFAPAESANEELVVVAGDVVFAVGAYAPSAITTAATGIQVGAPG